MPKLKTSNETFLGDFQSMCTREEEESLHDKFEIYSIDFLDFFQAVSLRTVSTWFKLSSDSMRSSSSSSSS